jgi:hypothetical protein
MLTVVACSAAALDCSGVVYQQAAMADVLNNVTRFKLTQLHANGLLTEELANGDREQHHPLAPAARPSQQHSNCYTVVVIYN